MPTPEPITAVTAVEALNTGTAIIQQFGLVAFITFAGFVSAAFMLYRRMKGAAR